MDSGIRWRSHIIKATTWPTCNQAGVNLLILGFILLYFIQKGGAGFGLIERQSEFLLQPAQPVVRVLQTVRTTGTRTMRVIMLVWIKHWIRVITSGSLICRLARAADIGRDLQHGGRLFKDRIRIDVTLLGPVILFENHLFRCGQ